MGIVSENHLFSIFKNDFSHYNKTIPDRSRYNRRLRKLQPFIDLLLANLSDEMSSEELTFIIDSMPLPICRFARCNRLKIMREDLDFLPAKGYSAIDKTSFLW